MKAKFSYLFFSCVLILFLTNNSNISAQSSPWATFDASDSSYVDFGSANNLNNFDTLHENHFLSVSLWVKWGDKSKPEVGFWANMVTMTGENGNGDNGVFWFQHERNNTKFEFAVQADHGRRWVQGTTNPVDGQWYFITGVYDGSQVRIYVDGVLEGTRNFNGGDIRDFNANAVLYFGMWPNSGNNHRKFDGDIDEVSIWNKALTVAEMDSLMTNPESVMSVTYDTTGLLGYWNFDDGTAGDLTPNGNNGSNGGGVMVNGNPLPVELISFSASISGLRVDLLWETASEINNDYFTVERSSDGINFEEIGRIKGKGNYNGNSKYTFSDVNPPDGISYYRLKQTDFDGVFNYSDILDVNMSKVVAPVIKPKMFVYPNPLPKDESGVMKIKGLEPQKEVLVVVTNILGQQLYSKVLLTDQNGAVLEAVDPHNQLPAGTYVIVATSNDKLLSKRLIIQ